jgi:hypothetical protein
VQVRIADRDPGYLECLLSGGGIRLDVVAQAIPQARTAYETAIVHFVQTYVEPEGLHHRSQLPQNIAGLGTEAAWVPERRMLLVTTASFSRGGNFLNIAVSGRSAAAGEPVAQAVARALVPVLPRGPDPGPPPG